MKKNRFSHSTEVLSSLSVNQQNWLTYPHSLTKKLRTQTHNTISHHLLYDDWGTADDASLTLLNAKQDEKTWIRRIEFHHNNTPWISAVVTIPESSITDETIELSHIGKQAIGDILFQDPSLTRSAFSFCKINDLQFTRHSLFHYKQKPLLIIETFFPAFFKEVQ